MIAAGTWFASGVSPTPSASGSRQPTPPHHLRGFFRTVKSSVAARQSSGTAANLGLLPEKRGWHSILVREAFPARPQRHADLRPNDAPLDPREARDDLSRPGSPGGPSPTPVA